MILNLAEKYAERDLPTLERAVGLLKHRRTAIQAGGNRGIFPAYLGTEFNTVYAAEPDPELFVVMCSRLFHNNNVVKLQVAFGWDRTPVNSVRARRDGDLGRRVHDGVTHVVPGGVIPTMRIDDIGCNDCDLLCLDVEGYEMNALMGACATVGRCKPAIMIELNGSGKTLGISDEDVRTWLRMRGYSLAFKEHSDEVYVHG